MMDVYAAFNAQSIKRREQLEQGTVLDEASLQSYAGDRLALAAACSHLALLGPV